MGLSHSYNKTNRTRHKIMIDLAYDIIKAHSGEIKLETGVDERNPDTFVEGEGSESIIWLPVA